MVFTYVYSKTCNACFRAVMRDWEQADPKREVPVTVTEGRELATVLDGRLDGRLVGEVVEAATDAPAGNAVHDAVLRVVEFAEEDPMATREALWALRGDAGALEGLEHGLSLSESKSTLALGSAIQVASTELASAQPDLRGRMPELMRWLEGDW
jgi:hypothetical protein